MFRQLFFRRSLSRRTTIWFVIFCLASPPNGLACLWDFDTMAEERSRFPEAHELIAGYFRRHSDNYYHWRIANRLSKSESERTPGDFDDIAVAYEKLGDHDKAIQTINEKISRWPNERRYESEANLGTFLIHSGQLVDGLAHIDKAIELNPDAHFGREIYQKRLVEYLIVCKQSQNRDSFSDFLYSQLRKGNSDRLSDEQMASELKSATQGILGMMRFGNHDSPILLEALGNLMEHSSRFRSSSAKLLAARAYLKASYADLEQRSRLRELALRATQMQGRSLTDVEMDLQNEMRQGSQFSEQIAADEKHWMETGKNLDVEYAKKYYQPLELSVNRVHYRPVSTINVIFYIVGTAIAIVFCYCGWVFIGNIRETKTSTEEPGDKLTY